MTPTFARLKSTILEDKNKTKLEPVNKMSEICSLYFEEIVAK